MIASSSSSSSSHSSPSYCCLLLIQSLISACCCSAARSLLAPAAAETHPNLNLDVRPQRVELNFQIGAIGSRPPSCTNKCNSCSPCQAVQVPTPLHQNPPFSSSSSTPSSSSQGESTSASSQFFTEYSNYKPEGWKCKCGNKIFNP